MQKITPNTPSSANQEDRAKNWIDTICQDLKTIGMAWEEAEVSAANREDWRRSVAQCVYGTGWPKSKSKTLQFSNEGIHKFFSKNITHIQSIWDGEAHDACRQVVSPNDGKQSCEQYKSVADKLESHSQPAETQSSSLLHLLTSVYNNSNKQIDLTT